MIETSPTARFHTAYGEFRLTAFRQNGSGVDIAMWQGDPAGDEPVLLRLQSSCVTSTALFGDVCDCADQIQLSLHTITAEGRGVFVYLTQEGRGLGLFEKVAGICEMNRGADTVTAYTGRGLVADVRSYTTALPIMKALGIRGPLRLMTNNPAKIQAMADAGHDVERVSLEIIPTDRTRHYLQTKKQSFGHLLDLV